MGDTTALEAELDALAMNLTSRMAAIGTRDATAAGVGAAGVFGNCCKCSKVVVGKDSGCNALGKLWHVSCFVCKDCGTELYRGGGFYESEGSVFCEQHYLERSGPKCSKCSRPIADRILRLGEQSFHPACFRCGSCDVRTAQLGSFAHHAGTACFCSCERRGKGDTKEHTG
eukprot:m.63020 g.63020  ORF g.63020 m.63020 type:complete len:171 (-) comp7432_c0_seq1:490-1002(-)